MGSEIAGDKTETEGPTARDTAEESVTWRGVQIRAAKGGGWRVGKNSRWKTYHAGRGCGEWARESGEAMLKANDGGR